jgi:hypothetical protein
LFSVRLPVFPETVGVEPVKSEVIVDGTVPEV